MIRVWHSHKHKINFLGIPKCGVTTVCNTLDINIDHDWNIRPDFNHKCFTVLRHPMSRLLSGWQETLRRKTCFEDTFEGFVNKIDKEGFFDEHIRPMSHYFVKEWVDHVLILDKNYEENLRKLVKFDRMVKGNVSNGYNRSVSLTTRSKIWEIYKEDYKLYGQYR